MGWECFEEERLEGVELGCWIEDEMKVVLRSERLLLWSEDGLVDV